MGCLSLLQGLLTLLQSVSTGQRKRVPEQAGSDAMVRLG